MGEVAAITVSLCYANNFHFNLFAKETASPQRTNIERIIRKCDIPVGWSYLIINDIADKGYNYYIAKYLLDPIEIKTVTFDEFLENSDMWKGYYYLITLTDYKNVNRYSRKEFGTEVVCAAFYK